MLTLIRFQSNRILDIRHTFKITLKNQLLMCTGDINCGPSSHPDFIKNYFLSNFSISSHPGWQDGTINVTLLFYTFTIYIQFLVGFIAMCSRFYRDMFVQMDSWVDLSIEEVAKILSLCFLKTFIRRPRFFIILFKTTFSRWPRWRRRV